MGIDTSGIMIVGNRLEKINYEIEGEDPEDRYIFTELHGMTTASEWYDAPEHGIVIGFKVTNNITENNLVAFSKEVKEKMQKFKEITGIDAELIGMQDVY